jgi:putative membrane-bound dehydrogenase-like protein
MGFMASFLFPVVAALVLPSAAQNPGLGLRVPPGFEVTEFADSKLANDIYCMTIDPKGRVVVASRGYIRILVDDDGDGRADRAIDFADTPADGAMGLLWEDSTLYVTGDGGLRRFEDANGDGKADGPSTLIKAMKTGGEHTAHALRRGPDGWLYLLCGDHAGIDASFAGPASPIRTPVAGCVVRFSPDLKQTEIVADGFRNPYGMDFNTDGELFTFDSDNERCVSLPWYEPTRFYHVIPGGSHGWLAPARAQFWRLPPYLPDVVAPVATMGRGSPTGVACYRHRQFPEKYRGGMFLLDWTFGKIHFLKLARAGASYRAEATVFAESVGENGFAPTALAVHPRTGDLFVSIGGRGTRGAVYRIRYPKGLAEALESRLQPAEAGTPTRASPPLPKLEWQPASEHELLRQAWSKDPLVRLRALIALRRHDRHVPSSTLLKAVRANWDHEDVHVRRAAAQLIESLRKADRNALEPATSWQQTIRDLGTVHDDEAEVARRAARLLASPDQPHDLRLADVRLVQLALGGLVAPKARGTVWEGYTPHRPAGSLPLPAIKQSLRSAFPSGDADLDRELSRTLAMLEDDDPQLPAEIAGKWTARSSPIEDLHYLIVLGRLGGLGEARPPGVTAQTAASLLALDRKIVQGRLNRDHHWPLRVAEVYSELARRDPKLHAAVIEHPDFGRPDHALFARAPGFDQPRAAAIFLKKSRAKDFAWNADLVQVISHLPDRQCLPVLRGLWAGTGLQEAILPILARKPEAVDRDKFIQGLSRPNLATVRACLDALQRLSRPSDGPEVLALIRALGSVPEREKPLRKSLAQRLSSITGQARGTDAKAWTAWFAKAYPDLAVRLTNPDGADVAAWDKRLAGVDWPQGDGERGRQVFIRANCAACHSSGQAVGPDLRGVAGRFSRADLFTAILQPSRDVSARYQTILVETTDGKIFQGMVIYEAVDSLILQTGPATTIRLPGPRVLSRRPSPISLMPAGLLDNLSNRDIADLYAHMKQLR